LQAALSAVNLGAGRYEESIPGVSASATYVTEIERDLLGRSLVVTQPNGVTRSTVREMRAFPGRPGILYYAELTLPHITPDSAVGFDGPITITWMNADNDPIGSSDYTVGSVTPGASGVAATYTLGAIELARMWYEHNVSGLIDFERRWHDIQISGGGSIAGSYRTSFFYDGLGRTTCTVDANGTATRYSYDIFDDVVKVEQGRQNDPETPIDWSEATTGHNLITVREFFFDHTAGPAQGVGNRNITFVRDHVDGQAGSVREMEYIYDFRDRKTISAEPLPPHEVTRFDNLDRVIARGLFGGTGSGLSDVSLNGADPLREHYEEQSYSQRGLMRARRRAIDPTVDPVTGSFLEWRTWFDAVGRSVGSWVPNAPMVKTEYDGLSRQTNTYVTDRGGDPAPGMLGSHAAVLQADGVTVDLAGDTVLEEMRSRYLPTTVVSGAPTPALRAGGVDLETTLRRVHDSAATGALSSLSFPDPVIAMHSGRFYDEASRPVRSVTYGTNSANDLFEAGGVEPTIDQAFPPAVSTPGAELVSAVAYNERGLIVTTTDPDSTVTKMVYDDLNRTVATIENFDDQAAALATVTRDATQPWGWLADLGDNPSAGDTDRITILAYNGASDVTFRVAVFHDGAAVDYQPTEYLYGPPDPGMSGSLFTSGDLLHTIVYPDDAPGDSGRVTYLYNRQGELVSLIDQNGTAHDYTRDDLGRVTLDLATPTLPEIDTTIDRIAYAFDDMSRLSKVTSLGGATVVNAIGFSYTGLWQIKTVDQNPTGDLLATPAPDQAPVTYEYDDRVMTSGNYSRLQTLSYPNTSLGAAATDLAYTYGVIGSVDDRISRFTGLAWNGPAGSHSADYSYAGLDVPVVKRYSRPTIRLDRYDPPDSTATQGVYPGYDQFGRIKRQMWVREWTTPVVAETRHVDLAYTYDKDSNPLTRDDARTGAARDVQYAYDGLDRHAQADRSAAVLGQQWSLDHLGNWAGFNTNLNLDTGEPDYTDPGDEQETRAFNLANELTQINVSRSGASAALDFMYDNNGNQIAREVNADLTGMDDAWIYTFDPWNRLVRVTVDSEGPSGGYPPRTRTEYSYFGLHQRATRSADADSLLGLDQRNLYYYDAEWRLLEERVDDDWAGGAVTLDRVVQRVWCPLYIDALIAFQVDSDDAQLTGAPDGGFDDGVISYALCNRLYSVIGLVNITGKVAERVRYTAYG